MVFVLAALVVLGAHIATTLVNDDSPIRHTLGMAGTLASGSFLYLIGILNVIALFGIWRVFKGIRRGHYDPQQLEAALGARGFLARILGPLMRAITRPVQMYPVGLLFGIGFDTATEVTLLALAGAGAATGLPWYAVLLLPLLFAAGMSGMDTFDGLFMTAAYDWAFAHPARRVYYNMSITGLSVAVALVIGSIELMSVLHDDAGFADPVTDWIAAIDLNYVGFGIVGLFIVTWLCAVAYWKLGGGERRWQIPQADAI
jgi:high-affinity nickel-transport protein